MKSNSQERTVAPHLESVMGVRLIHSSPEDETTAYFTQLQNLWESTLESLERTQSKPAVIPLAGQNNRNDKRQNVS
ncbi:hypothetical protein DdX_04372 [Ditylenchus destructor]|uniref:Uncharacterized protein n=1 Tax=Ditylenchus destructor TaxID=166010 RepID=A0AAD4R7P8_9BILA|nr:hypothetical protein DdX_04372 [Ditylenchus destructor]